MKFVIKMKFEIEKSNGGITTVEATSFKLDGDTLTFWNGYPEMAIGPKGEQPPPMFVAAFIRPVCFKAVPPKS